MLVSLCNTEAVTGAYCLLLGWGVYRAAEGLLKKVKKLFGESRGKNEEMEKDLREKLADYESKVDDAWDLLREATDKIREANLLSAENQKNMTALEVSPRVLSSESGSVV